MPFKDKEAAKEYNRLRYQAMREKYKAKAKAWREANPERASENNKTWVAENKDRVKATKLRYEQSLTDEQRKTRQARTSTWRKNNPDKARAIQARHDRKRSRPPLTEDGRQAKNHSRRQARSENIDAVRKREADYRARNRDRINAHAQKRRARLRSPLWDQELTELVSIEAHALAKTRSDQHGFKWEVDHIVPLFGRKVSGFHIWSNLRVIPRAVNRRKSNNFQPAGA